LFRNGRSQAVRLPKEFALPGQEVYVKRLDGVVILIPKDADIWADFRRTLDEFSDDFMSQGRRQDRHQQREPLG
jgi:antitoxin VapB